MTTPDDAPDMLAAELALGVLDGEARADALRRVMAEPDFAREVALWRAHFAKLFAEWPEVEPPAALEQRIVDSIEAGSAASADNIVRLPRRWAWAAGVATLVAACLVLALALRPQHVVRLPATSTTAAKAEMIAAITPTPDGAAVKPFGAMYDPNTGEIRIAGEVPVPKGRSAQLWVIADGQQPHALGLLDGDRPRVSIGGANLRRMAPGATLAVSIEPEGGSPTGLPTGPVVATGTLSAA